MSSETLTAWYDFQEQRFTCDVLWAAYQRQRRLANLPRIPWMPPDRLVYSFTVSPRGVRYIVARRTIQGAGTPDTFFHCVPKNLDGAVYLVLSGELDISNVEALRVHLDQAVRARENVVLNLQDLLYLDSTGINVLFETQRLLAREERRVVLVGPSPLVRRVLNVLSVESVMPICSTAEEALSHLRGTADQRLLTQP